MEEREPPRPGEEAALACLPYGSRRYAVHQSLTAHELLACWSLSGFELRVFLNSAARPRSSTSSSIKAKVTIDFRDGRVHPLSVVPVADSDNYDKFEAPRESGPKSPGR